MRQSEMKKYKHTNTANLAELVLFDVRNPLKVKRQADTSRNHT